MIALAIAAALGTAGFGIFLYVSSILGSPAAEPQAAQSQEPTLASESAPAITALGRLEPADGIVKVAAPSSLGSVRVSRLLVKEGSVVQANQPIAVMDTSDRLLAAAIQAEAEVREAQSRLAQVKAGSKEGDILAAQAKAARLAAELQMAEREYQRYQALYENGAISASTLDARRLALQTTAQALNEAKQTLTSVAEVRPTDVQQAESQVNVAIANLQKAKAELDTAIIRAPISGQVLEVHADPGEQVGEDGIVELGKTDQMYAIAEVYETDIKKVRIGQKAKITSEAFAGEITGIVDQVGLQIRKNDVLNTDPAADTDSRVVEVKIKLDDSRKVAGLTNLQVDVAIVSN